MTTHAELVARAQTRIARAEAINNGDPTVASLCALAAAILAARPREIPRVNLDVPADDTSPAAEAARAITDALEAAHAALDDIDVDDCGFPTHMPPQKAAA